MKRVLVVDDETSIVDNLVFALEREAFAVSSCLLGGDAIDEVRTLEPDLVVLDIGLPDMSGIDVCRTVRQFSRVPIIFLTARDTEIDRVLGLELGADDYVVKPFSPRELAARIRAILRRTGENTIPSAGLSVDTGTRSATYRGTVIELTPYEFGLLVVLNRRPGQVLSRERLLEEVWQDPLEANDRVIDTHIKSLRRKLASAGASADLIKTHRGFGYSVDTEAID